MNLPNGTDGRPPETADFAAERVRGGKRPPIFLVGWVMLLGGVMALGVSGRLGDGGGTNDVGGIAVAPSAPAGSTGGPGRSPARTAPPRFEPDSPTLAPQTVIATSAAGPIGLEATRQASAVFVHGDVYAQQVTWIYVSLQSLDGQVGGWASVSIPGAVGEGRDHRPALRFDVELAIPTTMAAGVLMVQANAYNGGGGVVASTRLRLGAEQ